MATGSQTDAEAVEGRWWLDFTRVPPRDPSGNEFVLSGGVVSIAKTGDVAGTYRTDAGWLTITLPMPPIANEGPWRVVAKLLLADQANPPDQLSGMIQAFDSSDDLMLSDRCALIRRQADA
jgi:hypothetical protein